MLGSGCNSNQNSYVLAAGGRSTSRVLAPPGGYSSFSIGMSSTPAQPVASTRSSNKNSGASNNNSTLPPKHPQNKGSNVMGNGRNVQSLDQGDSLDRMMKKPNKIPGLESHYSKLDQKYTENESSSSNSMRSSSQKPMGRSEYAEELRRQIEIKKEMDSQDDRNHRRSYSYDNTSSSSSSNSTSLSFSSGRHGGPRGALSANEYAASLRSQINEKNALNGKSLSDPYNPRNQIKSYSAPEPTRSTGRGSVPPGGHSSFSIGWEG